MEEAYSMESFTFPLSFVRFGCVAGKSRTQMQNSEREEMNSKQQLYLLCKRTTKYKETLKEANKR